MEMIDIRGLFDSSATSDQPRQNNALHPTAYSLEKIGGEKYARIPAYFFGFRKLRKALFIRALRAEQDARDFVRCCQAARELVHAVLPQGFHAARDGDFA